MSSLIMVCEQQVNRKARPSSYCSPKLYKKAVLLQGNRAMQRIFAYIQ